MDSSIIYCTDEPQKWRIAEWLNTYVGRIAVGRKTGEKQEIEILAYSDSEKDSSVLRKFAKQIGANYIRSVSSEGVTAID